MAQKKTNINEALDGFLFNAIERNPDYQVWVEHYQIPDDVLGNLHPNKILREYQIQALKHFIWMYEHDRKNAKHLLFNMATGTGKTLVMAAIVLYLYKKGYRNFLFLVHRDNIVKQAIHNLTKYQFEKYLFNPKDIKINNQKINVKEIKNIADGNDHAINFMFFSTQKLYSQLREDRENVLTFDDFTKNKLVILADEAHSLNVDTRKKNKTEEQEIQNWETAVLSIVKERTDNMLVEFTATFDVKNQAICAKYANKLVYRYNFRSFKKDGYSKEVQFLYNLEAHTEEQKRYLIVNAVVLSEYRRLLFARVMGISITPIVLIKSKKINQSEKDRKFFDQVIGSLQPEDLHRLQQSVRANQYNENNIINNMFGWLSSKHSGLVSPDDPKGLKTFTAAIRTSFVHDNTLIYNSKTKEQADLLLTLDHPRNTIRAIFSVHALNEGWDVLGLYDIIHFDISGAKKVSLQDIQFIGRGARLRPYELPSSYMHGNTKDDLFPGSNLILDKYKRKFDNCPDHIGRVLETLHYHFVKTGVFFDQLQHQLLDEGIIDNGVIKKTITMKPKFLASETYKNGFVLVNHTLERSKMQDKEITNTFNCTIKASSYHLYTKGLSDYELNQIATNYRHDTIDLTTDNFPKAMIHKALVMAENNFFRFNNLREHMVGMTTVDELIDVYLKTCRLEYTYEEGKEFDKLVPKEKLQLLLNPILPAVRKNIDLNMPRITGSKQFRPVSLHSVFAQEKHIYLTAVPNTHPITGEEELISNDERAKDQSNHANPELQYDITQTDWYAYNENYGTSEEKRLVKYIASRINDLQAQYQGAEIYLIRNELDYYLFSPKDGRRFSPDYMLIVNDVPNNTMYYQCLIEAKGGHLLKHDAWKERALISLADDSELVFDLEDSDEDNYHRYLQTINKRTMKKIKLLGFKFYNFDPTRAKDFDLDFQTKLFDSSRST